MPTVTVTASGETATYTYGGFEFGVDCAANDVRHPGGGTDDVLWSYNTIKNALGRNLGQRLKFFDGGAGITKSVSMWQATGAVEPHPLLCIQTYTAAAMNTWMDTLTRQVGLCYKQEFTADLAAGLYTAAQFNAWYADLRHIIDAHPNGRLVDLQMVGSESTERQGGQWYKQIVVPERCAIGNDTYVQQAGQLNPAVAFANSILWWNQAKTVPGCSLRISEGGYSRTNFTAAQRIQALTDAAAYLEAQGASSYNYWAVDNHNSSSPGKDWSVDKPGDEAVAAKLASLIS